MSKNKTLNVLFEDLDTTFERMKKAVKLKIKDIQKKEDIIFDSVPSFRSFMSSQKLQILSVIRSSKPQSIYELAKLVDRDFASVKKDCDTLEAAGFIVSKETKGEKDQRTRKVPRLLFDYEEILVMYPTGKVGYKFYSEAA